MAVTTIRHNPALTPEAVEEAFRRNFEGRYKIEKLKGPMAIRRDFLLVRNPFVGVSIKLDQSSSATKIVYSGIAPRLWARLLFTGLISFLIWNGPTSEVREYIESAPEFG